MSEPRIEDLPRLLEGPGVRSVGQREFLRLFQELQAHQAAIALQEEELRRAHKELEELRAGYFELYELAPVGYATLAAVYLALACGVAWVLLRLYRKPLDRGGSQQPASESA